MIELDAGLEEYIERHTEKEPDVLAQLSRATHQKMLRPRLETLIGTVTKTSPFGGFT